MRPWRRATAVDPAFAGASYDLALCSRCGTARTLGEPSPVAAAHTTAYYGASRAITAPLRDLAERDRLRELRGLEPASRVLEIGSGDGRFLERLAVTGFEATGLEPAPPAGGPGMAPIAPTPGRSRVIGRRIEEADLDPGGFDAVIFWHSLEHLDDPGASLRRIHGWLAAGGRVVIGVPNLASLQARLGGDGWFHQDVPRHRTHFSPDGLRILLERTGFEVVSIRHLVVEQNLLGMWQTLLNRLTAERDVLFRIVKRDRTVRGRDRLMTALAAPLLAPVALLAELAAGLARRGGSIAVLARRSP